MITGLIVIVLLVAGTSLLAKLFPTPNVWHPDEEQWLSVEDRKHFAGLLVAVDIETREIVAAASTVENIRADVERLRPERACRVFRVPGTPRESLRLLLDVGPCVSDDEYRCADGE